MLAENPLVKRPEGPDPPECTCTDVRRWLVAAFMALPTTPIYSARSRKSTMLSPNAAPGTLDWIVFAEQILGQRSRALLYLLTWARCEARRIAIAQNMSNAPGGGTVADFCMEMDIKRRTFDRIVERSIKNLAIAKNMPT